MNKGKKAALAAKKLVLKERKKIAFITLGIIIFLAFFSFASYSKEYSNKTYKNLRLGANDVSGLEREKLDLLVKENADQFLKQEIKLRLNDSANPKEYLIDPIEIGLAFDAEKTSNKIWQYGHQSNFFRSLSGQIKSIFRQNNFAMDYTLNSDTLKEKIKTISEEIDQPEKDFRVVYNKGTFDLATERQNGKRIDQEEIYNRIAAQLNSLDSQEILFGLNDYEPKVSQENADKALIDANKILAAGPLVLGELRNEYTISKDEIGALVVSKTNGSNLELAIDDEKLKDSLEKLANQIDQKPINSKFQFSDGKLSVIQNSQKGKVLDRESAQKDIIDALFARISGAEGKEPVILITNTKQADFSDDNVNSLAVVEQIGVGETNFRGSTTNRIHNIKIGAEKLNGLVIKPGETFSTVSQLSPIDANGGYLEEMVIKEDRTVPDFGGGLCQVSSTLFRAVLSSGLKITERSNHKYRVSYYEPPVGMDATIYDPAPDFKFQNNYSTAVLIQTKVQGTKIIIEMYGKKDGRVISISDSVMTDIVPAGSPVYIETDTMPAGQSKRSEKAHDGATASFNYKVTDAAGATLQERTFKSKYIPWPEKWLVGKGTVIPETCKNNIQDGDETGVDLGGSCPRKTN